MVYVEAHFNLWIGAKGPIKKKKKKSLTYISLLEVNQMSASIWVTTGNMPSPTMW